MIRRYVFCPDTDLTFAENWLCAKIKVHDGPQDDANAQAVEIDIKPVIVPNCWAESH